jgi:hypothetical protein
VPKSASSGLKTIPIFAVRDGARRAESQRTDEILIPNHDRLERAAVPGKRAAHERQIRKFRGWGRHRFSRNHNSSQVPKKRGEVTKNVRVSGGSPPAFVPITNARRTPDDPFPAVRLWYLELNSNPAYVAESAATQSSLSELVTPRFLMVLK